MKSISAAATAAAVDNPSISTTCSTTVSHGTAATTTPPTTPLVPSYPWNPHPPHQQQRMRMEFQSSSNPFRYEEEETPKIANHGKRRYSEANTAGSSASHNNDDNNNQEQHHQPMQLDRTESAGSLDCQSLQRSLKRVRLSSSPGELRLRLDLRHLVLGQDWVQTAEDVWMGPGRSQITTTAAAAATGCRLERSQVDPLRLILYLPHATVWIQIPRMYPHRPPTVTRLLHGAGSPRPTIRTVRISSADTPPSEDDDDDINDNNNHPEVGVPPRMPFRTDLLPSVSSSLSSGDARPTAPPRQDEKEASRVLHFCQWTCIMRLGDVLEFLYHSLSSSSSCNDGAWRTAPPMPDARGFLTPDRFDLGYRKAGMTLGSNAMDVRE